MKICQKCQNRRPDNGPCPICVRRKAREKYRKQKENGKVQPRTEEQRKSAAQRGREYYRKNKPKFHARSAVKQAFLRGEQWIANELRHHPRQGPIMFRPRFCPTCGTRASDFRIEADHWRGYDKEHWLDVFMCCEKCHDRIHVLRREAIAQGLDAHDGFRKFLVEMGYLEVGNSKSVEFSND
jgi:hypothetical protein